MADAKRTIKVSEVSDEALIEICQASEVITCECPAYLARILRQVRAFRKDTIDCMEQFPQDADTHLWLAKQAEQLEALLH